MNEVLKAFDPDPGDNEDRYDKIVTNKDGGKQSEVKYRMDLIPPKVMMTLGNVLNFGEKKYGKDNWKLIPRIDHINHAIIHVFKYLSGDKREDHLGHALTRLAFAVAQPKEVTAMKEDK